MRAFFFGKKKSKKKFSFSTPHGAAGLPTPAVAWRHTEPSIQEASSFRNPLKVSHPSNFAGCLGGPEGLSREKTTEIK